MVSYPWDILLSEQDRNIINTAGYDKRGAATFQSRNRITKPALLIIDMQHLFVGEDIPIEEAIQIAPTMIGSKAWDAAREIATLRAACRLAGLSVIYLRMIPSGKTGTEPELAIIDLLKPSNEELVYDKHTTSAFHDNEFTNLLNQQDIDGLIITGNSTSGCVRAAAVDAVQHGLGVIVPIECVCDRIDLSHRVALMDMWMKYAQVTELNDVMRIVKELKQPLI